MIDVHHPVDLITAWDLTRELGALDIEIAGDYLSNVLVQDVGRGEVLPVGDCADRNAHAIQFNGQSDPF